MELHINNQTYDVSLKAGQSLLSALRDELHLTGSKYGCGEGQCGACTVLLDGIPMRSCIYPALSAAGRKITTIEGLAKDDQLHPVQQAFLEKEALQCGYCTSGMIMSAVALLKKNPAPSRQEIITFMNGNICRCGTYNRIVDAITLASTKLNGKDHE
ncbi:MAG: (2Fe-2S)-binding protein [Bacteroidia bacterium]|nr:(2Fe-2S)-binding protein [Bacteroidia bacterium]